MIYVVKNCIKQRMLLWKIILEESGKFQGKFQDKIFTIYINSETLLIYYVYYFNIYFFI